MVARAAHIRVHLGNMPASLSHAHEALDSFGAGGLVILNDPCRGGTRSPALTMVSPVSIGDSIGFFVATHAPVADSATSTIQLTFRISLTALATSPVSSRC